MVFECHPDIFKLSERHHPKTKSTLAFHETSMFILLLSTPEIHLTRIQDIGQKWLHYCDSPTKFIVRDGIEDLPDRIDISTINEVATGTCAPFPHTPRDQVDVSLTPNSPLHASQLSFALLTASGACLAAQIAPDSSRWADWTDGLNLIRRASGHVSSPETDVFVQTLTEIGLKIRLLSRCSYRPQFPCRLIFLLL